MDRVALWSNITGSRTRKVRYMDRDHYEKLKDVILARFRKRDSVSLMTILEQPIPLTAKEIGTSEILPLILLVKNDLVARGILKITFSPDRSQIIELKNRKVRNF